MRPQVVVICALAIGLSLGFERWGTPEDLIRHDCTYDFIVVGAGAGGCRIADKLLSVGSVLLIEAGDEPVPFMDIPLYNLYADKGSWVWRYPIETTNLSHLATDPEQRYVLGGKVVGGGTSINGLAYQRGNKRDYDLWARDHQLGSQWTWESVLAAYKHDEANDDWNLDSAIHGRNGRLPVTTHRMSTPKGNDAFRKAAAAQGIKWADHQGGEDLDRAYFEQVNEYRGQRVSACSAFLGGSMTTRPNQLHVLLNSQVSKVIFDVTKRAKGVEILPASNTYGPTRKCFATHETVLAAGGIGTPKILLLSGIGNGNDLRELNISVVYDNPLVGTNLQNHPALVGMYLIGASDDLIPAGAQKCNNDDVDDYFKYGNGRLASNNMASFGNMYFRSRPDLDYADMEATFAGARGFELGLGVSPKYDGYFRDVAAQGNVIAITTYFQKPKSRGYVRLRSSDPREYPVTNFNYLGVASDADDLVAGVKRMLRVVNSTHFQAINMTLNMLPFPPCAVEEMYSDGYLHCILRQATHSNFHFAGTASMHGQRDKGVLDSRCRVNGVSGLRVADASAAPEIPNGHMMAPAYLIGARCGDFMREDYANRMALLIYKAAKRLSGFGATRNSAFRLALATHPKIE